MGERGRGSEGNGRTEGRTVRRKGGTANALGNALERGAGVVEALRHARAGVLGRRLPRYERERDVLDRVACGLEPSLRGGDSGCCGGVTVGVVSMQWQWGVIR
jgi:hypothetical protein